LSEPEWSQGVSARCVELGDVGSETTYYFRGWPPKHPHGNLGADEKGPRLRGRSSLIKVLASRLFGPERKRPSGRCFPQRAASCVATLDPASLPPDSPAGKLRSIGQDTIPQARTVSRRFSLLERGDTPIIEAGARHSSRQTRPRRVRMHRPPSRQIPQHGSPTGKRRLSPAHATSPSRSLWLWGS